MIHWSEHGEDRSAPWRSESGASAPRRVVLADDTLAADAVVIRSEAQHNNGNVTWEIVVDGLVSLTGAGATTQLHEANFGF